MIVTIRFIAIFFTLISTGYANDNEGDFIKKSQQTLENFTKSGLYNRYHKNSISLKNNLAQK